MSAAPFTTHAEALDKTQHHQQHRRGDSDLAVGGQQPDQHRRHAHHHQRCHQHGLAADLVAKVSEDHAAQGTGKEADSKGGEGRHLAGKGINVGEEQRAENQRRGGAVKEEVVPLDRGANEAGDDDAANV
jgi:hypothetical protein